VPVRFTPNASVFKGEMCGGVNVIVTDRANFDAVRTGLTAAAALRKLYPSEWQIDRFGRLLVNARLLDALKQGATADSLAELAKPGVDEFLRRRVPYLLYK